MHDQQISNQRRTHTVRFLCCFSVTIANNIESCAYLSSAIICRHSRDVRSDVCHGSTISSSDFLRKLNHPHKRWPTLSIVWLLLKSSPFITFVHFTCVLLTCCAVEPIVSVAFWIVFNIFITLKHFVRPTNNVLTWSRGNSSKAWKPCFLVRFLLTDALIRIMFAPRALVLSSALVYLLGIKVIKWQFHTGNFHHYQIVIIIYSF